MAAPVTSSYNSSNSLATESANGTVSNQQRTALQAEFSSIQTEINSIGSNTTYNGQAIFNGATTVIYMSDSSGAGVNTVTIKLPSGTTEQYIELSFTANSVQNGAQASEIEVFVP